MRPKDSYKARIFTTGLVRWPGMDHIENHDFKPVIDAALAIPDFTEAYSDATITIGFGPTRSRTAISVTSSSSAAATALNSDATIPRFILAS